MSARPPRFRSDPLPQNRGTADAAGVKADREEVPVKAIAALPFPSPGLGSGSRESPARSLSRVEQRAAERPLAAQPRATKDREAGGEGQRGTHVSSAAPRARRRGGRGSPVADRSGSVTHILTAAAATRKHQPGTETRRGTGRGEDK